MQQGWSLPTLDLFTQLRSERTQFSPSRTGQLSSVFGVVQGLPFSRDGKWVYGRKKLRGGSVQGFCLHVLFQLSAGSLDFCDCCCLPSISSIPLLHISRHWLLQVPPVPGRALWAINVSPGLSPQKLQELLGEPGMLPHTCT